MSNETYGAPMERGVVEKIENGKYRVSSITRDGIKSLPMRALLDGEVYSVGDIVYFFLFPDGDGMILTKR